MKLYSIAWRYVSGDDSICDDFGVLDTVFSDEKEAQKKMNACAEDDFNTWCADGDEPDMTHDDDYAKVCCCGSFYEYRIVCVYKWENKDA